MSSSSGKIACNMSLVISYLLLFPIISLFKKFLLILIFYFCSLSGTLINITRDLLTDYTFYFFLFLVAPGSSLLCVDFVWLLRVGLLPSCTVWASHCGGFSCFGARVLGAKASVVAAFGLSSGSSRALQVNSRAQSQ